MNARPHIVRDFTRMLQERVSADIQQVSRTMQAGGCSTTEATAVVLSVAEGVVFTGAGMLVLGASPDRRPEAFDDFIAKFALMLRDRRDELLASIALSEAAAGGARGGAK